MTPDIVPVAEADKAALWERLQDYIHELMQYDATIQPEATGAFEYPYFDQYWRESTRWPFWAVVDGKRAAFALVHKMSDRFEMAEFYSFPEFRRTKTALPFARGVIARFSGPWELTQYRVNEGAVAFWRRVIAAYPFQEENYRSANGNDRVRQTFTVP